MRSQLITRRAFAYWIPVLLWAGLIFYLSDISGLRSGFSTPIEIILRKIAHASEFGILAIFLFLLFFKGYNLKLKRSFTVAIFMTLLYAVSDEFHQVLVVNRDGNLKDIAVDFFGAYVALKIVYFIFKKKIEPKEITKIVFALAAFLLIVFVQVWESIEVQEEKIRMQNAKKSVDLEIQLRKEEQDSVEANEPIVEIEEGKAEKNNNKKINVVEKIPDQVLIEVPFSSQAPFGVWDDVHQEACEEMSLIMVEFYLKDKQLSKEKAEEEILKLKEFQEQNYGHYKDSSMEDLVKIAEEFYGIDSMKVVYDFEKEDLKKQLAKKMPIIVPTAGRRLGNPNFTPPGPLYHNLVLIGYDDDTIITNDPGTRKGKSYTYSLDILYDAIHDYEGNKEQIEQGRKAMIILNK